MRLPRALAFGPWFVMGTATLLSACATRDAGDTRGDTTHARAADEAAPTKLPFIEDDYPRALALAKETKRPLFVDAWAPWCHSCLSMREMVLTDPRLLPLAKDYVWLAIDTEQLKNAPFVAKFPNTVWPTIRVIDAAKEAPIVTWPDAATVPELVSLLEDARAVGSNSTTGDPHAPQAYAALLLGLRAQAIGDTDRAERSFREAIDDAPDGWSRRERAVEGLVDSYAMREAKPECASVARAELPKMRPSTSRATVLAEGLECAKDLPPVENDSLVTMAREVATKPMPDMLADDRSGVMEALVEFLEERGDKAGAREIAAGWSAFLDAEAARTKTPAERAVFDPHRMLAYEALGQAERAIPMLTQSKRDFPGDYNPPARLAAVYLELHQLDQAWTESQLARLEVYGPRAMRVLTTAADIAAARGDHGAERAALEEALTRTSEMTLSKGQAKLRAKIERRLLEMR